MALYLIERHECGYDENEAHVVNARDAAEVRRVAAEAHSSEGEGPWFDDRRSTVEHIGTSLDGDDAPRIILTQFNAG